MDWSYFVGSLIAHFLFNRFEPRGFKARLGLILGIPIFNAIRTHGFDTLALLAVIGIHNALLIGSVILYRLNPKHPLAAYPGPFLAPITNFWMVYHVSGGKRHLFLMKLHEKYGTHVRIGPNTLSIVNVDAITKLLHDHKVPRSSAYKAMEADDLPGHLLSCRSVTVPNHLKIHAEKRAAWSKGFSSAALENFGVSFNTRLTQLIEILKNKAESGSEVELDEWFKFFIWDFMGDLVLGGGFSMMQDGGDKSGFRAILEESLVAQTPLSYMPWLNNILPYLAALSDKQNKILQFTEKCIVERSRRTLAVKDLFYFFAKEDELEHLRPSQDSIISDAFLGIGAGSDTTVLSLILLFFLLLSHPDKLQKLREEVDHLDENECTNWNCLAQLSYLNACIDETLRLFPPVLTQMSRTPSNGHGNIIDDRYVPDGTTIYIAPLLFGRDPRYFYPYTSAFWPERWVIAERSANPEIIHNTQAFIPFSVGVTSCLGKQLAYRELQLATTTLIRNFDMKLVLNKGSIRPLGPNEMLAEGIHDWGTISIGKGNLRVTLESRV